ncbi:MAG TPA: adenylate/guanylate cyclase domain-containing protein [Candidatus Limnocylindrales bacterium]
MICAQCGTENEAGRKFCLECGAHLASGCPNCGAQNPPNAKFCGECGTALGGSAGPARTEDARRGAMPAATSVAERRLVSVLFADLVGFTTLSQDEDPEDTREFLTRYFELARTIVERYGGTIEKFIGDAVMAVWGTPTTHEDDAERAVRAALEIVDGVPGLDNGKGIQARAGVLTGNAAVTLGASGQGMVAGDLVNTASRLQSVAPPGTVLVGEATYHAAANAIRFEEAGEQLLKGKSSVVPAWRAAAVTGLLRGGTGRSEALEPPFTGRDEELRLLKELFHATQRERKPRLVSVVGHGGIGKSRLAWEFEKYIDGVVETIYWHHGRSPAYGEGISYWALAEMVRGRAGIAETDDPAVAATRLHEALVEWLPDEQERRWVQPRLAGLLALDAMPAGSGDELFAAWRIFFERIAERGSTVLVFEDIQWADEGLLDFVTELLDRSRNLPIFVVALARPELFDRRPGWGSTMRSLTTMSLEPLERAHMLELVTGTVPGIPAEAASAIVDRAEGIPLYAVETIRMLLDRGDVRRSDDGTFEMSGRLDDLAVPNSLQALIAARMDALAEHERRLLQSAAVMGKSFVSESLAAITGETVDALRDSLAGLVRRQMLQVDVDPRSPERGQYQFVQAVVREVAEASLSRADRRALHLAAARYYESLGDDELAGVQASHYVEAYHATPAGPEADALAAQARVSLRAAAERAIALHSNRQAVSYLEQALAVTPDPKEQAALHERAVHPALQEGLIDVAMKHARRVQELAGGLGDAQMGLVGAALEAQVDLSEHREKSAIDVLTPAIESVRGMPASAALLSAERELARALMIRGSNRESVTWADRVLEASAIADDALVLDTLITKGTALLNLGRDTEGVVLLRGVMQLAEQVGDVWAALRARNNALGAIGAEDTAAAVELLSEGSRWRCAMGS